MTKHERMIAAAKKREREADERLSAAYARIWAAVSAVKKMHAPRIYAAERKAYAARAAVTLAEMAALGIKPMETIVRWYPGYRSKQDRWAVRVNSTGFARLVPVGVKGTVLPSRVEQRAPWQWRNVHVTDEVLRS